MERPWEDAEERYFTPLPIPEVDVGGAAGLGPEVAPAAREGDEVAVGAEGGDLALVDAGEGAGAVVAHQGVRAGDAVVEKDVEAADPRQDDE